MSKRISDVKKNCILLLAGGCMLTVGLFVLIGSPNLTPTSGTSLLAVGAVLGSAAGALVVMPLFIAKLSAQGQTLRYHAFWALSAAMLAAIIATVVATIVLYTWGSFTNQSEWSLGGLFLTLFLYSYVGLALSLPAVVILGTLLGFKNWRSQLSASASS